jgi:hypothetical protein
MAVRSRNAPTGRRSGSCRSSHGLGAVSRHVIGWPVTSASTSPFHYLDAAQLLKHVLVLHQAVRNRFSLRYLYYDADANEGRAHREEDRFRSTVAEEVEFSSLSYQTLLERFNESLGNEHGPYLSYLIRRYGAPA